MIRRVAEVGFVYGCLAWSLYCWFWGVHADASYWLILAGIVELDVLFPGNKKQ